MVFKWQDNNKKAGGTYNTTFKIYIYKALFSMCPMKIVFKESIVLGKDTVFRESIV